MWIFSFIAFMVLSSFLLTAVMRFGMPDTVSGTYYQIREHGGMAGTFTAVMLMTACVMLMCMLDTGLGVQCLAFIGCAGLCLVGVNPNYCDSDAYAIHRGGAALSAVGCVGWCASVSVWPTACVAAVYGLYLLLCKYEETLPCAAQDGSLTDVRRQRHPWYWAEVAGFADVFITYWLCV